MSSDVPGEPTASDASGAERTQDLGQSRRAAIRLSDARALRAMAHPTRLSLIGVLRREGPLTATQAGELIGESSASCSFHLRQLAKYGLVEEAGGGRGRERPWRATTMFTSVPDVAEGPEAAAASSMLSSVLAERYFEALGRWFEAKPDAPEEWQRAVHFGDSMLYVTADELVALAEETQAMMDRFLDRLTNPELRPPGARLVTVLHLAFPGDLSGARPREDPPPHPGQPERHQPARPRPNQPARDQPERDQPARPQPDQPARPQPDPDRDAGQ